MPQEYDLFISYAHKDDYGNPGDDVSRILAIKAAIEREYYEMTGQEVRIFLDQTGILTGSQWRESLLTGLKSSKMMLAVLSENYFASTYCKREWEHYIDTELDMALPGEGITPIYVLPFIEFDNDTIDVRLKRWVRDLKRRQIDVDWQKWWPEGQAALERDDVKKRLRDLTSNVNHRLSLYEARNTSPTNQMPQLTRHFKGRRKELHELRQSLVKGQIGAIAAVNGIAGIGKTELALAYAWGYGGHYPGGRFYLNMPGKFDNASQALEKLQQQFVDIAAWKGIELNDAERQQPSVAFAKVCRAFTLHPDEPAMFIVDNIDDAVLLQPDILQQGLPRGAHIDILLTTRCAKLQQDRLDWVSVDALETEDGVDLLDSYAPIPEVPQDAEWKAAYRIVERLGGHALALNIVGVYLRWKEDSYVRFEQYLIAEGIELVSQIGTELQAGNVGIGSEYQEKVLAQLLEPTLQHWRETEPAAFRALQYAALCPPDLVPLPWLTELLIEEQLEWGRDQRGGTMAIQAVNLLVASRMLAPVRKQQAGLTAETIDDSNLARMHRVYQDILLKELTEATWQELQNRLNQLVDRRAEWLREHWGGSEFAWEIWPLRELAFSRFDERDYRTVILLDHIANILQHVGQLADCKRICIQNNEILQALGNVSPENADYRRDLSVSYERLGDLFRSLGEGSQARDYYQNALEIAESLVKLAPENADYRRDLSVSYSKLGDLFRSLGEGGQARDYYQNALEIRESLVKLAPENADYRRDLSVSYSKLGDLFRSLGEGSQARDYYQNALEIAESLVKLAPENADYRRDLSVSYERLGDLFRSLGEGSQARDYYQNALEIRESLVKLAPENADYRRDLSVSYSKLGDLFRSLGEGSQARDYYQNALEIAESLVKLAPENAGYRRDLSVSYNKLGDLFRSLGEGSQARDYYQKDLEIAESLVKLAPENADYRRDLAVSHDQLFQFFAEQEEIQTASQHLGQSLQILITLYQRGALPNPEDQTFLNARIELAQKIGLIPPDEEASS